MNKELFFQALFKLMAGMILTSLLLFVPAGTLSYWNAWLFMGILFIPMLLTGIFLLIKNPELLRNRLDAKEQQAEQRLIVKLSGIMFVLGFAAAGLNFRYGWLIMPGMISWIAAIIFLLAYALYVEVLRENIYLSRTVGVQKGQKVIDTGLYGIVRHPMYSVTLVLFFATPFVLGSIFSAVIFLVYPVLIVKRISSEEKILEMELRGYDEYKKKVRYKVIPFVW